MTAIILIVFLAVFALMALALAALSGSKASKQALATLKSALNSARYEGAEEIIDVRKNDRLSTIPWVHDLLVQLNTAVELRLTLEQAGLKWTPGRLMLTSATTAVVSAFLVYRRTYVVGASVMLGALAGMTPFVYVWYRRARRLSLFQEKLPQALDLMVTALRAGHSMNGALGTAAREAPEPIGQEFRVCFEEQNYGIDLRTAMGNLVRRVPLADVRMMSTAMLIHKESGGNLAEVLDKTSAVIRDRFQILRQIRVHTAQGRLSGWILCLLPFILGTVLYFLNPIYMKVLFFKPLGNTILEAAAAMNLVGLLIINKIIRIRV